MANISLQTNAIVVPDRNEKVEIDVYIDDALNIESITGDITFNTDALEFLYGSYIYGSDAYFNNADGKIPTLSEDRINIEQISGTNRLVPLIQGTTLLVPITEGIIATLTFKVLERVDLEFSAIDFLMRGIDGNSVSPNSVSGVTIEVTSLSDDTTQIENNVDYSDVEDPVIPAPVTHESFVKEETDDTYHLVQESTRQDNLLRLYESETDAGKAIGWEWESNPLTLPEFTTLNAVYVVHSGEATSMRVRVLVKEVLRVDRNFTPSPRNRYRMGCHARGNQFRIIVSGQGQPPPISNIDIEYM